MTILIRWLIEYTWVLYPLCALGFIIYVARALSAQRARNMAQFILEHDIAAARVVRAWAMALVFVVIGAVIFAAATFIFPNLDLGPLPPTPTLEAGLELTTPTSTPAPSPTTSVSVPTFTPASDQATTPTQPGPTETPTPESPTMPDLAVTGEVNVRFSNFARLLSYGLPGSEITTAQPLMLTLQWQALEGTSPLDYLVFTHLLAEDGHLIAQHDGSPAAGARPTTGWTAGETIVDTHPMSFHDAAYTGPATIVVGMYDPANPSARAPTEMGNDYVILPVTLNIVP